MPPPIETLRDGAPANRARRAGLQAQPGAGAQSAPRCAKLGGSAPGFGGGCLVGLLLVMGTKAKVGREQLYLFTSVILGKFPEFREGSVDRVRSWSEALPAALPAGGDELRNRPASPSRPCSTPGLVPRLPSPTPVCCWLRSPTGSCSPPLPPTAGELRVRAHTELNGRGPARPPPADR